MDQLQGLASDGHDVRDAVSATWSLLGNRLGAQAGVADPSREYLASLHRRLADRPRPWANRPTASNATARLTRSSMSSTGH
jgi:hypothetical protein